MKVNTFASPHSTRVPQGRRIPCIAGLCVPPPKSAVPGGEGPGAFAAGVRNTREETRPLSHFHCDLRQRSGLTVRLGQNVCLPKPHSVLASLLKTLLYFRDMGSNSPACTLDF